MTSYNLMKAADRARMRADRQAELDAIANGAWPRDTNEMFRWSGRGPEHAALMCRREIAYLDDLEQRIQEGAPALRSYEGWKGEP